MTTAQTAVERASQLFRAHGGSVLLVGVDGGTATVRFGGFCAGCPCRTACLEVTVRPLVTAVEGVDDVQAAGARTSPHARAALAAYAMPLSARPEEH